MQVWQYSESQGQWLQQGGTLLGHNDWVRDVAWAPNLGLPKSTIASCGQDGRALVWTEDAGGAWTSTALLQSQCYKMLCPYGLSLHLRKAAPSSQHESRLASAGMSMSCALLQEPVWRVSWSITGNILAVTDGKDNVTLWKEATDGQWQQITSS
ncbi:GTPase-activating protein S13 [Pseudocyphellaria aurata]|nr:GTPase-activating protein S13 [Pseudocyphellaria aurata]